MKIDEIPVRVKQQYQTVTIENQPDHTVAIKKQEECVSKQQTEGSGK